MNPSLPSKRSCWFSSLGQRLLHGRLTRSARSGIGPSGPDGPLQHSGQLDRVHRKGSRALIIECKSLVGDIPESPKNLQLRDQAALFDIIGNALLTRDWGCCHPAVGDSFHQSCASTTGSNLMRAREEMYKAGGGQATSRMRHGQPGPSSASSARPRRPVPNTSSGQAASCRWPSRWWMFPWQAGRLTKGRSSPMASTRRRSGSTTHGTSWSSWPRQTPMRFLDTP